MIRVDAHQHFWKLSRNDYEWLTPDLVAIYRDFMPDDLAPHLNRSGVDRTVVVQAATTDAETAFLLDLARQTPFIAGVVGWTDLESPGAVKRIEALAANRRMFGLRPMLQDLPDDEWLLRKSVAPAIDAMKAAKLRLDALVKPRHLQTVGARDRSGSGLDRRNAAALCRCAARRIWSAAPDVGQRLARAAPGLRGRPCRRRDALRFVV